MKILNLRLFIIGFIAILGTALQGCGGASNYFNNVNDTQNYDVITLAGMDQNFSTFTNLLQMADLDLQLDFAGPVTVFIPTNQAFEEMPREDYNFLIDPANRVELTRFLRRHILPSKVYQAQFNTLKAIETAVEEEITINTTAAGKIIYVGGARIIESDIEASDGVIHIVNSVIEPTEDVFME